MKHTKKILSILLVAALLLTYASAALALEIDLGGTITTGGLNDLNVRQAARDYMDTRAAYLLGETETMEWVVTGIADDEATHRSKLAEENIILTDLDYTVVSMEHYDTESYVIVSETVTYSKNSENSTETVLHDLTVIYEGSNTFVLSDKYIEHYSTFESCSYVPPIAENSTNMITDKVGSAMCIINIGISQRDYEEEGTNITKYATELQTAQTAWCSIFVRWCAYKANIPETVIPLEPLCSALKQFYINEGKYYERSADFEPEPGDIFFKRTSEGNHVGIVDRVEGNLVWIVHGNASDKVKHNTMNKNSTEIQGYARPAYENTGHVALAGTDNGNTHTAKCAFCEAEFVEAHTFEAVEYNVTHHKDICLVCGHVGGSAAHIIGNSLHCDDMNHWNECMDCNYRKNVEAHTCAAYSKNLSEHWKVCSDCGTIYAKSLHIYLTMADGRKKCKTCGYITGGIEGGTIMSASDCGE